MSGTHPVFTHPGGSQCVWAGGLWFVPLDAGGEGYACEKPHPTDEPCDACGAEPGEPCRFGCLGYAIEHDELAGTEPCS